MTGASLKREFSQQSIDNLLIDAAEHGRTKTVAMLLAAGGRHTCE